MTLSVQAIPAFDPALRESAARLAEACRLPLADPNAVQPGDLVLTVTATRLELHELGHRGRPLALDFAHLDVTSPAGRTLRQPLAKAVGFKKRSQAPSILDATAGLGEDAYLLATLGCTVTAIERQPVVAALLCDAHRRLSLVQPEIAARLTVRQGDARQLLADFNPQPQVVYLDPMFPAMNRKTAERRPLQLLRRLAGDDLDADALLPLALQLAAHRVVVKRPPKAPPLAGLPPAFSCHGRGVRWDVYPRPRK
ncbi:MAG: class I SAM-dependent methyltransferase [Phycisphaeraceae bacterium]|nr:class I SAM-dependent methyltransferase [Phycisphaeraceae bacterium]